MTRNERRELIRSRIAILTDANNRGLSQECYAVSGENLECLCEEILELGERLDRLEERE